MHLGSSAEHDLIVHIGSGGVYGALTSLRKNHKPSISHTHYSEFPIKDTPTGNTLVTHMLSALHSTTIELWREHKRSIRFVHVVFASPWFSSFSKSVEIKKDQSFVVQPKTVEKLVSEQVALMFKDASKGESTIIESAKSHMRVNGYETTNPFGKEARSLDVAVYASMAPKILCEEIENEIFSTTHPKKVMFHTFPYVSWSVVSGLFSKQEDFALIDVGGEVTDMLVVRRGAISSLASFPVGKNHLIRKTAIHFESRPELADSLLSLYSNDMAEDSTRERTAKLISAFAEEWGVRLNQALSQSSKDNFLPQKAYYVADDNMSQVLDEVIGKHISKTIHLSKEAFSEFVEYDKVNVPHIFLALEALYLNREYSDGFVYKAEQNPVK
jgi:cell division ATPase FtsA